MINVTHPYKEDLIVPISVSYIKGELSVDAYPEYVEVAKEYIKSYTGRYFSEEALSFLGGNIPAGYVRYDDLDEYYLVYAATSSVDVDSDIEVTAIENAVYDYDETEFEADIIKENDQPASLIIDNGRIAAIASVNYFIEDYEDEVELAVETLPEYRGRGYARAVLSDMVNKVLAMGKTPTYRVSCRNVASIATAVSCGFTEIGKEYYLNCYKEEE